MAFLQPLRRKPLISTFYFYNVLYRIFKSCENSRKLQYLSTMSESVPRDGNAIFKLYRYDPSMAAAIIFIILFLLVTGLHTYQLIRTKTWFFSCFVVGGFSKSLPERQSMFLFRG